MQKLLIRHLGKAHGDRVEEFGEDFGQELILGRDNSAQIRFDPDRDDLVSRQHSKIIRDPANPGYFQLVDLQSRNGTFLNRQRIYSPVRLNHNDVIQLGAGGPEVRFEMDPPPKGPSVLPGALDQVGGSLAKATRESWMPDPLGAPRPVGRHTIERMLGEVFTRSKKDVNRSMWMGIAALAMIILVGSGVLVYLRRSHSSLQAGMDTAQQQNKESLERVQEELKKQPAAAEETKQEVQRLESELEASKKREEENHQATLKALEAQRRQAAELARIVRQQQEQQAQNAPVAEPHAAPDPGSFDVLLTRAKTAQESGRFDEAQDAAAKLTQLDPSRWEGFAIAGQAAAKLNDLKLASEMYQKAILKAPNEARASLESQLKHVQESAQK
jgi:FHA domain